jgi:hypothetical protein
VLVKFELTRAEVKGLLGRMLSWMS